MAGGSLNPQYAPLYVAAGHQFGIPPQVLAGVADVETNGGASIATSSTGANGLMQFEPGTAKGLGVNPADPRSSIFGAAKLLVQYGYHQNPLRAIGAYNGGPGNPQYGYANQVMQNAKRLAPDLAKYMGAGAVARAKSGGGVVNTSIPSTGSTTSTSGGGTDYLSAGIQALMSAADKPISTSGKVSNDNVLGRLLSNVQSGQYSIPKTTTITNNTTSAPAIKGVAQSKARGGSSAGYVNPISGATVGRTDMGVDANLPVGHPIVAIGDSKVIGISPNWYAGQPYVLMQLTSGPKAGQYWYVAEQIAPSVHAGQTVRAGQPIGTYASSGTGIEIGWGSPTPGRTLAQQQGNTGDSSHGNAPAGLNFRNFLGSLK